jgi:hypothetical protein
MLLLASLAFAAPPGTAPDGGLVVPLTLAELPYDAVDGVYRPLPMQTSLDLGYDGLRLGTYGVHELFGLIHPKGLRYGLGIPALTATNVVALLYFGGRTHEEWHRAVLASHGASSRNTIYDPANWGDAVIAVDSVTDADLARLKAESPADTAHLQEAGNEGNLELARTLGDAAFFEGGGATHGGVYFSDSWLGPTILFQVVNVIGYQSLCASPSVDALTDEMTAKDVGMADRDFTGADCDGWLYDLDRPDEPYDARGPTRSARGSTGTGRCPTSTPTRSGS